MSRLRRPAAREDGQAFVIVIVCLIVMLGLCAAVIDIGHAYLAQRRLQSSVDAAALAGAQALPDVGTAGNLVDQYGADGSNAPDGVDDVQMTMSTKCIASAPGCSPYNALVVKETGSVPTTFGKIFGISSIGVHASATACSPCSSVPLDIMLVLDRTGSMCQFPDGSPDPNCTDMENARSGLQTFLGILDPSLDRVGLAVLPPAKTSSCPYTSGSYTGPSDDYLLVPLSSGYSSGGVLNPSSPLVNAIDCVKASGSTSYASALEAAQAELVKDGRPGVQKIIVFETDGAANTGPSSYPSTSEYRAQPCQQGVDSAATIKATGTLVYSIGYDLGADRGGCQNANGSAEQPFISPETAVQEIASPNDFYNQPTPADMSDIYSQVASDLLAGTSRLIPDSSS